MGRRFSIGNTFVICFSESLLMTTLAVSTIGSKTELSVSEIEKKTPKTARPSMCLRASPMSLYFVL